MSGRRLGRKTLLPSGLAFPADSLCKQKIAAFCLGTATFGAYQAEMFFCPLCAHGKEHCEEGGTLQKYQNRDRQHGGLLSGMGQGSESGERQDDRAEQGEQTTPLPCKTMSFYHTYQYEYGQDQGDQYGGD